MENELQAVIGRHTPKYRLQKGHRSPLVTEYRRGNFFECGGLKWQEPRVVTKSKTEHLCEPRHELTLCLQTEQRSRGKPASASGAVSKFSCCPVGSFLAQAARSPQIATLLKTRKRKAILIPQGRNLSGLAPFPILRSAHFFFCRRGPSFSFQTAVRVP